jgi:hypothetical protein
MPSSRPGKTASGVAFNRFDCFWRGQNLQANALWRAAFFRAPSGLLREPAHGSLPTSQQPNTVPHPAREPPDPRADSSAAMCLRTLAVFGCSAPTLASKMARAR